MARHRDTGSPPPSFATRDVWLGLSVVGGANRGETVTLESGPTFEGTCLDVLSYISLSAQSCMALSYFCASVQKRGEEDW